MTVVMLATATATAMLFAAFLVVLLYGSLTTMDRGAHGVPQPCGPVAWRARRRYQARHAKPDAVDAPQTVTVRPSVAEVPSFPKVSVSWFVPPTGAAA